MQVSFSTVIFTFDIPEEEYRYVPSLGGWKIAHKLTEDEWEEQTRLAFWGNLLSKSAWGVKHEGRKSLAWQEAEETSPRLTYDVDDCDCTIEELTDYLQRLETFFNENDVIPCEAPSWYNRGSEERVDPGTIYHDPTPVPFIAETNTECAPA